MAFQLPFTSSAANLKEGAFFSPGDECLNAILHSIRSAKHSLHLCVFTISDDRITAALLETFRKGITIQLVTDNEKLFDKGSDIRALAQAGLTIRVDNTQNHMHHKFAIIDSLWVLTGSYNWTRSAALYNHENVLITDDKPVVAAYSKEFTRLWQEMQPFV
ncbi:phospholipase D-like domain-containing protein [Rufibacter radiotolerans]|uniref:phospholipase D-like domain-containing protein n=1 Tax=Rufibacter radiotolerans TaxID=1379910 RepID=UPI0006647DD3|nr:phospholipase D-like domain-containing protein [Rufibacter radiotolerans]